MYVSPTHVWLWSWFMSAHVFFCLLLYFLFSRHSISQVSFVSLRLTLSFALTYAQHTQRHSFDILAFFFYIYSVLYLRILLSFSVSFSLTLIIWVFIVFFLPLTTTFFCDARPTFNSSSIIGTNYICIHIRIASEMTSFKQKESKENNNMIR